MNEQIYPFRRRDGASRFGEEVVGFAFNEEDFSELWDGQFAMAIVMLGKSSVPRLGTVYLERAYSIFEVPGLADSPQAVTRRGLAGLVCSLLELQRGAAG